MAKEAEGEGRTYVVHLKDRRSFRVKDITNFKAGAEFVLLAGSDGRYVAILPVQELSAIFDEKSLAEEEHGVPRPPPRQDQSHAKK